MTILKIYKTVSIEQEVEVDITTEEISKALHVEDPQSLSHALVMLNDVAKVLNGIPDDIIKQMHASQRKVIADFLRAQLERYKEPGTSNSTISSSN